MRIGIRPALVVFVLATVAVTGGIIDALWWRTAQSNSRMLAERLNQEIIDEVKKELNSLIGSAEAAHGAIRTIFAQEVIGTREADKRESVFLSQIQAQPAVSWIAFGWPDGAFFAAHKLGDQNLEMMEIPPGTAARDRRVDKYRVLPTDIEFQERKFKPTGFDVTAQPWYRAAFGADKPMWTRVTVHPGGGRPAVAFAGAVDVDRVRQGVLAVMIDLDRLSRFLAGLSVGTSGEAFVIGPDGIAVAVPDPEADEVHGTMVRHPELLAVARETHIRMLAQASAAQRQISEARVVRDDIPYAVTVTPLGFMGWEVTTVVPESDFLGAVNAAIQRLSVGLASLIVAAVAVSVWLARRFLVAPLLLIASDLGRVQMLDLGDIRHRPARLSELDQLSRANAGVAAGLAAFRRYMPADVVRTLVAEGVPAQPGGSVRPLTILFTDIEGFTGLSERAPDAVVPLLGRYITLISAQIHAHGGTIDKFIGDAVMAFWGAPTSSPNQAMEACRAALACRDALAEASIMDDRGAPLVVRIGINSGEVLVGNIGSVDRLNYTAIGDAVNVANRCEAANKTYGTQIIIGDATRRQAGAAIVARELDTVTLPGRAESLSLHELIGLAVPGTPPPAWIATYAEALRHFRAGCWPEAIALFEAVVRERGGDTPSTLMIGRCRAALAAPVGVIA